MSLSIQQDFQQSTSFAFTAENSEKAKQIIAKYPKGRQASAVMPLLSLAQAQHQNWIPKVAMDVIADMLEMPSMRVYEVATFYSMYNLAPTGKYVVELCTTTPCWLRGSNSIVAACEKHLGVHIGETTSDGQFTLREVECLGACVNAPMAQIGHDFYEDLTPENVVKLLEDLQAGKKLKSGSQTGRTSSEPEGGITTLKSRKSA